MPAVKNPSGVLYCFIVLVGVIVFLMFFAPQFLVGLSLIRG